MKKLMFALVAAGAAAVMADGIESQNIVGYTVNGSAAGAINTVSCFDGVNATGAINIQDIVPSVREGDYLFDGGVQIMTLDDGTATAATYFYITAEGAEGIDGVAQAGWFDEGMSVRLTGDNAVTFDPGQGFLVMNYIGDNPIDVRLSGQVPEGDLILEVRPGATMVGNNSFSNLDIQSIQVGMVNTEGVLSDPDAAIFDGGIQIMTLDDGTATADTYFYITAEGAEGIDGVAQAGWFDEGMSVRLTGANAVTFAPGEGFLLMNYVSDPSIPGDCGYIKIPGNNLSE